MQPVPPHQQVALVERLTQQCGGSYSPETRRKYFITGPQWAAAYQGQALFYAPTRKPITYEGRDSGISAKSESVTGAHTTAMSFPARNSVTIADRNRQRYQKNAQRAQRQMLDGHHRDFLSRSLRRRTRSRSTGGPRIHQIRVRNTVDIGHELGAQYAVYWPGSLGYFVQGAVDEMQTLRWYAESLNAHAIAISKSQRKWAARR
jgi:xylose isomerase